MQDAEPLTLNVPTAHTTAVADVLPAAHAYPAVQLPLHDAVVSPGVAPYRPAPHAVHTAAPPKLYVPAGHRYAVALVDPAGHAYPGAQAPEHAMVVIEYALP